MTANAWSYGQLPTHDKGELRGLLRGEHAAVARELRDKRKLAAQLSAEIGQLERRLNEIDAGLGLL